MVLLAAHGIAARVLRDPDDWCRLSKTLRASNARSRVGRHRVSDVAPERASSTDWKEKKKREGAAVSFLPPVLRMTETKDPDPPTRGTGPFGIHYCSDTRLRKRALGSCHHLARWRESAWVPRLRRWIDCSAKSKCACSELLAHQEWTRHVFFPLSSWSLALK